MRGKRVLIVDDDADTRAVLRAFLERVGYEPAEAAEGVAALAQAESWRPDAILLDVRMPGLDGYEVCRRLKANPITKPIPVIFVTAVENLTLNRLAYAVGAIGCLVKPFRQEALLTILQAAIAGAERRAKPKAKREAKAS